MRPLLILVPLLVVAVVAVSAVVVDDAATTAAAGVRDGALFLSSLLFFFDDDEDFLLFLCSGDRGATSTQSPGASLLPFMNRESRTEPEAACMCIKRSFFRSSPHKSCTDVSLFMCIVVVVVVSLLLERSRRFRFCCSSSVAGATPEKSAPNTLLKESCRDDGSGSLLVAVVAASVFCFLFSFPLLLFKLFLSFSNALEIFPLVALKTSAFPLTTSRSLSKSVTMMYRSISLFKSTSSLFIADDEE